MLVHGATVTADIVVEKKVIRRNPRWDRNMKSVMGLGLFHARRIHEVISLS
jgi:hypothetical protein